DYYCAIYHKTAYIF
nr:immunoglobulin light chain junction region [Macaca mulatta]